jgi:hypothetical protein
MVDANRHRARRAVAGLGVLALGAAAALVTALPAAAAPAGVDDVQLRWTLNQETGGGAYFGGCNFLSAGKAGNTGSSRVWTEADGFYASSAGSVTIEKPTAAGGTEQPTWATKCVGANGSAVSPAPGSSTLNQAVFSDGTGTVDVAAGTATVSWDGDVTVAFYGGMTYWTFSDPVLTVAADGTGQLTGTASGYGTSMEDQTQWVEVAPEQIVLADLTGVSVDADGFTVTPDYLGVEVTPTTGTQTRTGASWGSFPQSFVTFQGKTGQTSYWYSSGGSADPKKVTQPLSVAWTVDATGPGTDPGTDPGTGEEDVDLEVTVPAAPEPTGELTWSVGGGAGAVSLGTAQADASAFTAAGQLKPVTVSDTRTSGSAWTVNGAVSDFAGSAGSFDGSALGWTPAVTSNTVGAVVGAPVAAGTGSGLSVASTLASAPAGHAAGSVAVDAALALRLPLDTPAGDYTGVLTLTVVG